MQNKTKGNQKIKKNWLLRKIKKYQVITFTLGFLLFYQLTLVFLDYSTNKEAFIEKFDLSIWFWVISIIIIYFLQWLLVVWIASKFTKEKLKQKLLIHPIATIIFFILYIIDLPYRFAEYGSGIISIFEIIIYYAFVCFVWWLLFCWLSSKIFKKKQLEWSWYKKMIEKIFIFLPIVYKIILSLFVALFLFFFLFTLLAVVFNYSGQDLKMLFL